MPSDAARPSSQPARIGVPDQLQQSRRQESQSSRARKPDASASPAEDAGRKAGEGPARHGGILGQLETERAHD